VSPEQQSRRALATISSLAGRVLLGVGVVLLVLSRSTRGGRLAPRRWPWRSSRSPPSRAYVRTAIDATRVYYSIEAATRARALARAYPAGSNPGTSIGSPTTSIISPEFW